MAFGRRSGMTAGRRKGRGGGSATSSGVDFQARLAAWMACAILAEKDCPPLWGWPESQTLESVFAETDEPTDDLLVTNSAGSRAFLQAKFRLILGKGPTSPLGSAMKQFVHQVAGSTLRDDDRLVLAVGPESSAAIRDQLPRILTRLRALPTTKPIGAAATNNAETATLAVIEAHVVREWTDVFGKAPTRADLRALLGRIRVSVHDLYSNGAEIREAQTFLRVSILKESDQAGVVFADLIAAGLSLSVGQSGADRPSLQRHLTDRGIDLRATPSYRDDIDKLVAHSTRTIGSLSRFASIDGSGGTQVTIRRTTPDALHRAAESRSVVVTGDPGAGKSATLFEFATEMRAASRDVVVLVSDGLAAGSLGQLRAELGLGHEVADVLQNWPGVERAFLVVDALDAARGDHTQQTLLDLIGAANIHAPRWRIAASIRRFDLRYNKDLQAIFVASAPVTTAEFQTGEFAHLSHFNVPVLTDDELDQLTALAPETHAVLSRADTGLRELARVPFNLRLLAELSALGVAESDLAPISTQLQLLGMYWDHRVVGSSGGDARETVLRATCEAMVVARALRIDRQVLQQDVGFGPPLTELLSNHVLVEDESTGAVTREVVTFGHHILFDYAVARLLLRGSTPGIVQRTTEHPDLLLLVRPSYDLHFRYLWAQGADRTAFWALALDVATEAGVPAIGIVIAPVVAASLIQSVTDAQPLLDALSATDTVAREVADVLLGHLVAARLANDSLGQSIPGDRRQVWAELAAALAEDLRVETAFMVRNLLMELCADPDQFEEEQRDSAGAAARALLSWSLEAPQHYAYLVRTGIAAAARTFVSDPTATEELLRAFMRPARLELYGYEEMPALADEVDHLLADAPELVRDIYEAAFSHEEVSDAPTAMGGGVVLSLTSNRRQDFEMSHYKLAETFPTFLRAAPTEAVDALAAVRKAYAKRRMRGSLDDASLTLDWRNQPVEIQPDGSAIWDFGASEHDDEDKILSAFEAWLTAIIDGEGRKGAERVVEQLQRDMRPASLWRRVLRVASDQPMPFVPLLEPLLVSPAALYSRDLAVAPFLAASFEHFTKVARRRIERAIMSLPETPQGLDVTDPDRAREVGENTRDRLLGQLKAADLISAAARKQLVALEAAGAVPDHDDGPPFEWGSRTYTDRDELADQGVDVDAAPNRALQDLQTPVATFAREHLNGSPPAAPIDAIVEPLRVLWNALQTAGSDGVNELQADAAWGDAASAAEAISRGESLDIGSPAVELATEILTAAATHRLPSPSDYPNHFDESPSWGGPAPRLEAAQGLVCLAWHEELATSNVLALIDDLSRDEVPAVRFHVAQRLKLLLRTAPETMWSITDRMLADDSSTAVLHALVTGLPRMTLPDGQVDRLQQTLRTAFARASDDRPGVGNLREACVASMTSLHVMRGADDAASFVDEVVIGGIKDHPEYAERVLHVLRDALTLGVVEDTTAEDSAIRRRTIDLMAELLVRATDVFNEWNAALKDQDLDREDPRLKAARTTAHIIDGIASQVYFATGIFDEKQGKPVAVSLEQRKRLYSEAESLLDSLCDVAFGSSTHHVLETLEAFIPFDPRGVFLRIARAVKAGQAGGYQGDSLGAGLVVRLVERYLAEHRTLLQQDDQCRQALVEVLDTFVRAGWPAAMRLTYGLQDIFR